jgi:hypothetical protein
VELSRIKKWLVPEDKGEWIITIAWLVFAVFYLARTILFQELEDSIFSFPAKLFLLRRIEAIGLIIVVSGTIILSMRKIRISGFRSRQVINLSAGIFMAAVFIVLSMVGHFMFSKFSRSLFWPDHMIAEFERKISESDLDAERKSLFSIIVARDKYHKNGQISSYLDNEGKFRQYEPTAKDKEVRKNALFIKSSVPICKKNAYLWSGILILSLILGIITPMRKDRGAGLHS